MPKSDYVSTEIAQSRDAGFTCVEAEKNILRRMLMRKGVAEDIAMDLSPRDFSNFEYGMVYKAIQTLVAQQRQVDLISVDQEMTRQFNGRFNPLTIADIAANQNVFTLAGSQDIKDLIKIVRALSIRRQAIANLEVLVSGLCDPTKDVDETLSEIGEAVDGIHSDDTDWVCMEDVLLNTYSHIEKRQKGEIKSITSGLKCLDRLIGGFYAGEMTILAARPSVGKSAFGINIALAAAQNGFNVGVVSCEMSDVGLGQRLLSHGAFVDGMTLRKADVDDDAWSRLSDALSELSPLPITFMFDCMTVEDVVNASRKRARKNQLDLLIVDYLQFMETKRKIKEEHLRIGYISHTLKRLAKRAGIPVIVLAQVNRNAEGRMPNKSDLKDSGMIEQDADGIIFLHRPDSPDDASVRQDDRGSLSTWKDRGLSYLVIGVAKQRNGPIGQTSCLFDASIMQYIEIARDDFA